jgi:hypothetical protein
MSYQPALIARSAISQVMFRAVIVLIGRLVSLRGPPPYATSGHWITGPDRVVVGGSETVFAGPVLLAPVLAVPLAADELLPAFRLSWPLASSDALAWEGLFACASPVSMTV